jgi:hypothetical protein
VIESSAKLPEALVTTPLDLDELTRQTRRQEFSDGLHDLQTALVFLLLGAIGGFLFSAAGMEVYVRALIWNRELTVLALVALLGLLALLVHGARRAAAFVRGRVLWRGQGQAVPLRMQVRGPAIAAAVGVVVILILAALMLFPTAPLELDGAMRALAATSGIGTGILYLAMGRELALQRLRWVGVAGVALSATLFLFRLSAAQAWILLGVLRAATLSVSGGLALRERLAEARSRHG